MFRIKQAVLDAALPLVFVSCGRAIPHFGDGHGLARYSLRCAGIDAIGEPQLGNLVSFVPILLRSQLEEFIARAFQQIRRCLFSRVSIQY